MSTSYSETFSIPPHLVGLALGDKHTNMVNTRTLKGISNVFFKQKDRTFTITGYNEEIVKVVRDVLEYCEREICIARSLCDFLQKDNDKHIQEIIYTSGLVRAEIHDDNVDEPFEKQSEFVKLKLVGTKSSVDEAKSCLKVWMSSDQFSEFQNEKEVGKKPQAKFTEQFKVASHLVGLAIGKKGANIENARKLSDIVKIEQHDDDDGFAVFNVYGNSYDSVTRAREMLEIAEGRKYIQPNTAGLVIGSGGATIKDMIKKTKVLQIEVKEKEITDDGLIPVVIIGHPNRIDAVKLCIESKLMSRGKA